MLEREYQHQVAKSERHVRASRREVAVRASESQEQRALFQWAAVAQRTYPELRWLHSTLNGMPARSAKSAAIQVGLGMKRGVPDVFLDVARGGYHGLRIELKAAGGRTTPEQLQWIAGYVQRGYCAVVAIGWLQARDQLLEYIGRIE